MSRWPRCLLIVEVVICFAPSLLLLAVGLLMSPIWLGILGWALIGSLHGSGFADLGAFATIWTLALVAAGGIGVIGLGRVVYGLVQSATSVHNHRQTRAFAFTGIAATLLWVAFQLISGSAALALISIPSLCASAHIVYLARRMLFPKEPSIATTAA